MSYRPGELVTVREEGEGSDIPLCAFPTDHPEPLSAHEDLGRMYPGELALVISSRFDACAGWWCIQVLKDGMMCWVIAPHVKRVRT